MRSQFPSIWCKGTRTSVMLIHSQFGHYIPLTLFLHSLFCHFLRHTCQNVIYCFCALDSRDDYTYVLNINKHLIVGFLTQETVYCIVGFFEVLKLYLIDL